VGGFDPALSLLADWDLWLRLGDRGPVTVGEQPLVAYRLHEQNMHVLLGDDVRLRSSVTSGVSRPPSKPSDPP
jgi:hypothetical protein